MSYVTVRDGLHERFATIPGLAQYGPDGQIVNILPYAPTSIHILPTLYTVLDRFERATAGQVTVMRYRLLHRYVVAWQDDAVAESQIDALINALGAAVDADPQLGGRIPSGLAQIVEGQGLFYKLSGTVYQALDCYSAVVEKAPYRSGI